jgi:hypothetical protein
MAGGPIFPYSAYPVTANNTFPSVHVGAGSNAKHTAGLGVAASIGSDSIWRLHFRMPPSALPSGTGKLDLWALANATSGAAKVNPKWASVAVEEAPDTATLQAEGVGTITWSTGDNDQFKQLKITLDADTLVAGEDVVMDLTFETSSWTLAVVSTWIPSIIFE